MVKSSVNPTVMVVDDFADIRSMLRLWLENRGCRVVEAADGKQAVETAERERPDLILMDLFMPEVDGFATTLRIRKHAELRDVPIIAISAYGELGIDIQLRIDPLAVGFNEYVAKPFGPEQLGELLERFVPKKQGRIRHVKRAGPEAAAPADALNRSGKMRRPQQLAIGCKLSSAVPPLGSSVPQW